MLCQWMYFVAWSTGPMNWEADRIECVITLLVICKSERIENANVAMKQRNVGESWIIK